MRTYGSQGQSQRKCSVVKAYSWAWTARNRRGWAWLAENGSEVLPKWNRRWEEQRQTGPRRGTGWGSQSSEFLGAHVLVVVPVQEAHCLPQLVFVRWAFTAVKQAMG